MSYPVRAEGLGKYDNLNIPYINIKVLVNEHINGNGNNCRKNNPPRELINRKKGICLTSYLVRECHVRIGTHAWLVKKILNPVRIPLMGRPRRQPMNLVPLKQAKIWGYGPLRSSCCSKHTTVWYDCEVAARKGVWAILANLKEEVILTRLLISHTWLTHAFILKEEQWLKGHCGKIITIKEILLECKKLDFIRKI